MERIALLKKLASIKSFAVVMAILLMLLGIAAIPVNAEDTEDLADKAVYAVGITESGEVINSSVDGNVNSRAIGQSGETVSKNYGGYPSHTPIITIDGRISYCIQPELNTPSGTTYTEQIMSNDQLRTVLTYGYGGNEPGEFLAMEGGNVNDAYMDTWMAARIASGEPISNPAILNDPCVRWLLDHSTAPAASFEVGNSPQKATWEPDDATQSGKQYTGWYTTSGGGEFTVEVNGTGIGVQIEGQGESWSNQTGTTGQRFRLFADAYKEGSVTVRVSTTATGHAALLYLPAEPGYQSIVGLKGGMDPVNPGQVVAEFTTQTGVVNPRKEDATTGNNVGDAVIDGTILELYRKKDDVKIGESTVTNGKAVFENVVFDNYYIKEKKPGEGFVLSDKQLEFSFYRSDQKLEVFYNVMVKGQVNIKKFALPDIDKDEAADGELKPLENVEFTLSLNSNPEVKYVALTDAEGSISFKDIPYGTYTLTETKTPDGFKPVEPIKNIKVSENGKTYEYYLGNDNLYSDLRIVKKDKDSGKVIPVKGATFKVLDLNSGKFVVQYPASHLFLPVSEWKTDETGKLGLDKPLKAGNYAVIETKAPEGYYSSHLSYSADLTEYEVDGQKYYGIPFIINLGTTEVVEVDGTKYYNFEQSIYNTVAKGKIAIQKTGEMLDGTTTKSTEFGELTTFNFSQKNLAGCVYEVKADGDIVTPEGTLQHHDGDVVATLTTNADGYAVTAALHLGKYTVKEVSAPDGYTVDGTTHHVEVKYIDQNTTADHNINVVKVEDDRQNAIVTLEKTEEVFDGFDTDKDNNLIVERHEIPANDITFGLYTAAPIADNKGGTVPADTLVSLGVVKSGQLATTEELPYGKYYLKELKSKDTLVPDALKSEVIEFSPKGNAPVITFKAQHTVTDENGQPALSDVFVNYLYTTSFEFSKTEVSDGKPLPDTEVTIYDSHKAVIWTGKTDENGQIKIPELPVGTYYYQETNAPEPYLVDDALYAFTIKNDGKIIKAEMSDTLAMGNVTLEKTAQDRKDYVVKDGKTEYETITLADCEFAIQAAEDIVTPEGITRALKGDTIAHVKTDKKGKATVTEASFMTKEGAAERQDQEPVDLTLWSLDKTETPEGTDPAGKKATGEDVAGDKDVPLEDVRAGIRQEENLFLGKYNVIETKAPDGYAIDENVYPFELVFADDHTPVVTVDPIKPFNEAEKNDFELRKSDISTGKVLEGAGIAIYDSEKHEIYKGTTGSDGKIHVSALPTGKYYFQEFGAPEGYELDNTLFEFEIKADGDITRCEMTNTPIPAPNVETGIAGNNTGLMIGALMAVPVLGTLVIIYYDVKAKRERKKDK